MNTQIATFKFQNSILKIGEYGKSTVSNQFSTFQTIFMKNGTLTREKSVK